VIAQAVAARDPDAARAAMVEHISLASKIETERAN
jgi:DNA-binding FadR family transcriptional regulator